ncbi:MAG: DUF4358 domain-containing protein [Oscillospiraceae bacterium]|nr:DUF4358 domain-containing protein [Oscillospiraceae bacterium]
MRFANSNIATKTTLFRITVFALILSTLLAFCSCDKLNDSISDVANATDILPFVPGEEDEDDAASSKSDNTALNIRAPETKIGSIINELYGDSEYKGLIVANDDDLQNIFLIDPIKIDFYRIIYTDGIYGVRDICIIKPIAGYKDAVLEALRQRKDSRTKFFEHYDVNDAHAIMLNAEIYTQGEYIIYLAVDDIEAAKLIVDKYIPY